MHAAEVGEQVLRAPDQRLPGVVPGSQQRVAGGSLERGEVPLEVEDDVDGVCVLVPDDLVEAALGVVREARDWVGNEE
jgi:hypothetical protein